MNRFREERNQAMNKIFDKYNLPRNMTNNQIKRRVKYHDWFHRQLTDLGYSNISAESMFSDDLKQKYIEFLMNRTVFNEKKRKDVVKLAIDYDEANIISLRSPVIRAYLMEMYYFFGGRKYTHFYEELKVFGKFREDKALETVLKKRITFLRKLKKRPDSTFRRGRGSEVGVPLNVVLNAANEKSVQIPNNYTNFPLLALIRNLRSNNSRPIPMPDTYNIQGQTHIIFDLIDVLKFMKYFFPIPPHTNTNRRKAATTIQKTTRGMLNRKKVTTLKKQATARTARAERMEKLKSKRSTRKRKR